MTVSTTTSRADYTGNGTTTAFAVPFYFLDDSHLTVLRTQISTGVITTLALTTNYTVSGAGNPAGGTVTCVVAPTADQKISILRNVPFTQLNTYVPNDPFPAASHERALDKLTMEVQQLDEAIDRALSLPANTPAGAVSAELPTPQANRFIAWNSSANGFQNLDASSLASVTAFATAFSDTFSGNGVQTAFALSAHPGSLANLRVSISGVVQRPTIDYTWVSGTTLTFTSAPAAGTNNILVQYATATPGALGITDGTNLNFIQSGTGATTRTIDAKLKDVVSLTDFGAVAGGSTTVNNAAIDAVEALPGTTAIYVPPGVYDTTKGFFDVTVKRYYGEGQIKLVDSGTSYKQASNRVFITTLQTAPSTNRYRIFDNLGPKQVETAYSLVTNGANPGTLPTTYTNYVEWAQSVKIYDFTAGFNTNAADHQLGRSGAAAERAFLYHGGGGDLAWQAFYGECFSNRAGATHFLANPALIKEKGNLGVTSASGAGCYLNHSEYIYSDRADAAVAVVDRVRNYTRVNAGATLNQVWIHDRPQSGGSQPIDCFYSLAGTGKVGFDTTPADFGANKAAIAIKADDRIYLTSSSATDALNIKWYATTLGSNYITADSSNNIRSVSNGFAALTVVSPASAANGLTIRAATSGNAAQIEANGAGADVGILYSSKGTGTHSFFVGANNVFQVSQNQVLSVKPFLISGATSGSTTLQAQATASGTLTLPSATDTLVGLATTDTLSNKTLATPSVTGTLSSTGGANFTTASAFSPQIKGWNQTADANAGYFMLKKTRAASGAGSATVANDTLGTFMFQGHDTGGTERNACYLAGVADSVGASSVGGRFELYAGTNGWIFYPDGRMRLPTFTVGTLPAGGAAGMISFATNGRKNGEGAGAGTGVLVFFDGTAWRACDTGATVAS